MRAITVAMRLPALLLTFVLSCADGVTVDGAATALDAATDTGDAGTDLRGERGPREPVACTTPLTGDKPFGVVLAGRVDVIPERYDSGVVSRQLRLHVYFPAGRRPGAPVVFASDRAYSPGGIVTSTTTLDGTLSAPIQDCRADAGLEEARLTGTLEGPTGGLAVEVSMNLADAGSDIEQNARGHAKLCPVGPAPEAVLLAGGTYGPTGSISFIPNVPIDATSARVRAQRQGLDVAVAVTATTEYLGAAPQPGFPPGAAITFDTSGTKDVLGRPFTLRAALEPLMTTAVLADLTFATAPPAGAIATTLPGDTPSTRDGALQLSNGYARGPSQSLLALPSPGAEATQLRVTLSASEGCNAIKLSAVDALGEAQSVTLDTREPAAPSHAVRLPAGRPLWLALSVFQPDPIPQTLLLPCSISLDELAFE